MHFCDTPGQLQVLGYSTADLGQDPESVSLGSRSDADLAALLMVGLVANLGRSAGIGSNCWKLLPSAGVFLKLPLVCDITQFQHADTILRAGFQGAVAPRHIFFSTCWAAYFS